MNSVMLVALVAAVVVVNLGLVQGAATSAASTKHRQHHRTVCPVCFYRNHLTGNCTSCDICQPNQIIRRPCTRHRNTVCGVFSEFHKLKFKVAPMRISENKAVIDSKPDASIPLLSVKGEEGQQTDGDGHNSVSVTSGGSSWKILTLSLIGALVLLSVFLFMIVFTTCYLTKRKTRQNKQLLAQSDCYNHSFQPFVLIEGGEKHRALQATMMRTQIETEDEGVMCYPEAEASEDLQELLDDENTDEHFKQSTVQMSSSTATSPRSNPFSHIISDQDSRTTTTTAAPTTSSLASSLFHIIHNPLSLANHPSLAASGQNNNGHQDYVYFNPPVNSYLLK